MNVSPYRQHTIAPLFVDSDATRMELAQETEADIRIQNFRKAPQLNYVVLPPKRTCNLTEYPV